jgi:hypothetical protein
MSDRKEHESLAAAEATRARIMKAIRRQAEDVVEQLQRDVFRLIEEAHRDTGKSHAPVSPLPPEPSPISPIWRDSEEQRERRHLDDELRHLITDIVRAEIAALDIVALVKAEIDVQLRAVTKLLQERLKDVTKPNLQKLTPILSRRRL